MNWLVRIARQVVCPYQIMRRLGGQRVAGRYELGGTATWRCCDCGEEITKPMEWNPPAELLMPGQVGEVVYRMRGDEQPYPPNCRPPRHVFEGDAMDSARYATMHEQVQRDLWLRSLYTRGSVGPPPTDS